VFVRMPGALAYPLLDKTRTWSFDTGPEPYLDDRVINHVRGRMLGGSSSLNGMVYVRGNPRDFDNWAKEGLDQWSYAHCLPYFKKLESFDKGANEYRGGNGPVRITSMKADLPVFQAFLTAGQQAGHQLNTGYNAFRQEGVHVYQANIDHGIRASAGRAYLRPAVKRGRVELRLGALVTKVQFSGNKLAVGVEYEQNGAPHSVEAEREVILCGGAYNSPHLLLLSGVGDPKHLKQHGVPIVADVPGVGQNLEDHVAVSVRYRAGKTGVSPGMNMNALKMGLIGAQWLFGRTGLGARNLWETGTFFKSHEDADYVNIQHEFLPMLGDLMHGQINIQEGFQYQTCLMRPRSRGSVSLHSADPRQLPKIVNNYLCDRDDQRSLIAGAKHTDEIIQQRGWDGLRGEAVTPPLRKMSEADVLTFLRANSGTQYHPSASCRMGTGDNAVVDDEGRVRGVQNLRIVDASIMPHITSGNLHCPTLMIAEKISDRIRGRSLPPQLTRYDGMLASQTI
jgi:choline dehydrogenase